MLLLILAELAPQLCYPTSTVLVHTLSTKGLISARDAGKSFKVWDCGADDIAVCLEQQIPITSASTFCHGWTYAKKPKRQNERSGFRCDSCDFVMKSTQASVASSQMSVIRSCILQTSWHQLTGHAWHEFRQTPLGIQLSLSSLKSCNWPSSKAQSKAFRYISHSPYSEN